MTIEERVIAVLSGQKPDQLPFVDRLESWYEAHQRSCDMPAEMVGLSLNEVHRQVGIGRQLFVAPYALRLRGVEVVATFNGDEIFREYEPVIADFPDMGELVPGGKAGVTTVQLVTRAGRLQVAHELLASNIETGTSFYSRERPIKGQDDYRAVEYILERAEFVPLFDDVHQAAEDLDGFGFVVPRLHRIPFQQVLLEYVGEIQLFYELHDNPGPVQRLLRLLDEQLTDILDQLRGFSYPYVEFPDNLHGLMTNPRLFEQYCLPDYIRYTDVLHAQGKYAGSHTDGDVRPLLKLLAESQLDVCESFSPAPLTQCPFEEAWQTWADGPIIWGGIPSPILEPRTSESDFEAYVHRLLDMVDGGRIILGVGDMVMVNNDIGRVAAVAEMISAASP